LALFLSNLELLFLVLANVLYSYFAAKQSKNFVLSFVDNSGQRCDPVSEVSRYISSLITSNSMCRKPGERKENATFLSSGEIFFNSLVDMFQFILNSCDTELASSLS
jgi:hypothetical protein